MQVHFQAFQLPREQGVTVVAYGDGATPLTGSQAGDARLIQVDSTAVGQQRDTATDGLAVCLVGQIPVQVQYPLNPLAVAGPDRVLLLPSVEQLEGEVIEPRTGGKLYGRWRCGRVVGGLGRATRQRETNAHQQDQLRESHGVALQITLIGPRLGFR